MFLLTSLFKKENNNNSTINGLISLLGDCGLLNNKITIIEVENIRKFAENNNNNNNNNYNNNNNRNEITYEQFYLWLRGISCFLYYKQLNCTKKSLHKLLVQVFLFILFFNSHYYLSVLCFYEISLFRK